MKYLLFLVLTVVSFGSLADCKSLVSGVQDVNTKNAMLVACLDSSNSTTKDVIVSTVSDPGKMEDLARSYSTAVGAMARDLGMAANEFIKTDAGTLAVAAVIWTIFGDTIQSIMATIIIVPITLLVWYMVINYINPKVKSGEDENGIPVLSRSSWDDMTDSQNFISIVAHALVGVFLASTLVQGLFP